MKALILNSGLGSRLLASFGLEEAVIAGLYGIIVV